jgi:hypothetical protein
VAEPVQSRGSQFWRIDPDQSAGQEQCAANTALVTKRLAAKTAAEWWIWLLKEGKDVTILDW